MVQVEFPNPEEGAGALQLSFEEAQRSNCQIVLANDPDAGTLSFFDFLLFSYIFHNSLVLLNSCTNFIENLIHKYFQLFSTFSKLFFNFFSQIFFLQIVLL